VYTVHGPIACAVSQDKLRLSTASPPPSQSMRRLYLWKFGASLIKFSHRPLLGASRTQRATRSISCLFTGSRKNRCFRFSHSHSTTPPMRATRNRPSHAAHRLNTCILIASRRCSPRGIPHSFARSLARRAGARELFTCRSNRARSTAGWSVGR
jgi:hypothetical protein